MSAPIRARLGELIETQLEAASPNTSAALRAYVLLGFAATGVDMAPFDQEIRRTAAAGISPNVRAALDRIQSERPTGVLQASYALPPSIEAAPDQGRDLLEELLDPFMSAGVEV